MFTVILRWCFLPDTLGQTPGLCTLSLLKLSLVESELFTSCCPALPISITASHPQTMASGFQASSFVIITYQLPRLFQFVIGSISRWQPVISLRNMRNKRVNYPFTAVASQRRIHCFTWVSNLWVLTLLPCRTRGTLTRIARSPFRVSLLLHLSGPAYLLLDPHFIFLHLLAIA